MIEVMTMGNVQDHIISWNTPLCYISHDILAWQVEKGLCLALILMHCDFLGINMSTCSRLLHTVCPGKKGKPEIVRNIKIWVS